MSNNLKLVRKKLEEKKEKEGEKVYSHFLSKYKGSSKHHSCP